MDKFGLILVVAVICVIWTIEAQRQCPRLQKPWNGQIIGTCNRNVGAQCVFQCRDPYILVGSTVRSCRSDGTWSGQTTACEIDGCADCTTRSNNCPNLYNPEHGHTIGQCTPGIVGQTCQFYCNGGHVLEGQAVLRCLTGGQWSAVRPACRATSAAICENIVVPNGYVTCSQQGGLTVCAVSCEEGYMIVGSSVVTCSSSGDWSDQVPTCRRTGIDSSRICPSLVAPDGGRLVGSCTSANTGDTCQLVCLSGYRPTDTRVLICQSTGRWSNSLPRCIGDTSGGAGCPSISVSQGTATGTCRPGRTGQICVITCNSGYILTGGSTSLVCQSNGLWSDNIPTCSAQSCPALPPPASGGQSGICSPGRVGQTCSFYCNSGYQLVGLSTLICGNDGRWSGNPPYCSGATCPSVNTPVNGARSGSCTQATVGQSCSFSCQAGYVLTGQATIYCQAGGVWSSSTPTCLRTGTSSCASLVIPSHGFMIGTCAPGRTGETCVFGCEEGYVLHGQRTLTCQSNGQWSHLSPHCERSGEIEDDGNCPILTPPPNGEFIQCNNRPGGQCIVACQSGYVRSGSRVRTCLGQGTWSGFAPTCTRTVGYTYKYKVVPLWSLVFG